MDSPVRKSDEIFRFLDAPPTWFAMLVWTYPLIPFPAFCGLFILLFGRYSVTGFLIIVLFPTLLMLLFCASRWFRTRVVFIVPCWFLFMNTFLGITQGALTSAISKAFSAVTSQLQASEMIRADVHESEVGSQKTPDSH
jgi:hypothetical protein